MDYDKLANRETGPESHLIGTNELPPEMREVVKIIGLQNTLRLILAFSGSSMYFPKYETITLGVRNKLIRKEFTGKNLQRLAIKYNLSVPHLRTIIKKDKERT